LATLTGLLRAIPFHPISVMLLELGDDFIRGDARDERAEEKWVTTLLSFEMPLTRRRSIVVSLLPCVWLIGDVSC
jgi:hypothetical protein